MKLGKVVLVLMSLLMVLTACTKREDSDQEESSAESVVETTSMMISYNSEMNEPDGLPVDVSKGNASPGDYDVSGWERIGFTLSTEYVEARSVKENYALGEQIFECEVVNHKIPDGFCCYDKAYIEFLDKDQWIRLYNKNVAFAQWAVCALEDNITEKVSRIFMVDTTRIEQEIVSGQYRFVIFLSDRVLYAPFTVGDLENENTLPQEGATQSVVTDNVEIENNVNHTNKTEGIVSYNPVTQETSHSTMNQEEDVIEETLPPHIPDGLKTE